MWYWKVAAITYVLLAVYFAGKTGFRASEWKLPTPGMNADDEAAREEKRDEMLEKAIYSTGSALVAIIIIVFVL